MGPRSTFSKVSLRMGDQNLLSRAPLCFGRHVKSLVVPTFAVVAPTPVSRRADVREAVGRKIAESLSQHDEKHVVPTATPLSVGKG
jgi:hypothetical protein